MVNTEVESQDFELQCLSRPLLRSSSSIFLLHWLLLPSPARFCAVGSGCCGVGSLRGTCWGHRAGRVALCSEHCAARTHAPVNRLSKDNFCFSFPVWSCPAASNEKCALSRVSGAGDLCGNCPRPLRPGLLCLASGVEGAGGPGREPGFPALPAPAFTAPPSTSTPRTFYSRSPRKLSALSRSSKHHYPRSINTEILAM